MWLFQKKKEEKFLSPYGGKLIKIEDVPDPVFSEKMMGDGFAVEFDDEYVYAPFDAKVVAYFETGHAIGLKSKNHEVLIHVGIDTVSLKGEPFEVLVKEGQEVKQKDKLIKVNKECIKDHNISLVSPVVFTDGTKVSVIEANRNIKALEENIIIIK